MICSARWSIASSSVTAGGAARQGNKGDQVDADQLSELLRRGALRRSMTRVASSTRLR